MFKLKSLIDFFCPTLHLDSGGGGSSSTGTQTQVAELPEWAKPYAKSTLEKGAALSEQPYQTYNAPRIAGFSPMQQQAQQGAANMQTNAGTGMGMGIAGAAALGGLNQDYNGMMARSQNFGNRSAAQYMSPYAMNALQPELQEQARQSAMLGQQNNARAVGQGAFGGSRSGLVEAERQRNLGIQQGNTIATGMNTAYNNAMNQFNADQTRNMQAQQMNIGQQQFGANLGLQGLNTALQGANQLGALGGQQFQQGMDINKLQSAYGGQQQALQQQGLSQAYQDFLNQQNQPYKQVGFMSDLIRGLPLGQVTSKSIYEPDPNMAQQIGALGMGAYGLSKFMAEGGMAYADGGSVDSADNVSRIVSKLSDQQLQQAAQAAQARGDIDQLEAIQSELGMRASLKNGIAGGITPQMAEGFSGGGILAFQDRGVVDSSAVSDDREEGLGTNVIVSPGNQALYNKFGQLGEKAFDELGALKGYTPLTVEERRVLTKKNFDEFQQFAGKDPYAPMIDKIAKQDADRLVNLEKEKGAAAFEAIPAILEGRGIRGLAKGAAKIGSGLSAVAKADAAERRALANQEFIVRDAERKERMGLTKDAMSETDKIEAAGVAAAKAKRDTLVQKGKLAADLAKAYRPVGSKGSGNKEPKIAEQNYANILADLKATSKPKEGETTTQFNARLAREASKLAVAEAKTSESGPGKLGVSTEGNEIKRLKMYEEALADLEVSKEYVRATPERKKEMRAETKTRIMSKPLSQDGAAAPIPLD